MGRIYYFTKSFDGVWFCSSIGAELYPTVDAAQKDAMLLIGMGDVNVPCGYADGSFAIGDEQTH